MSRSPAFLAAGAAALTLAFGTAQAADYTIDSTHTQANFRIDHLGFSTMWGRFNEEAGTIVFDPADPASGSVEVVIQAASIDTNHAERDEHLRSPDFFNAAEFPEITFRSTAIAVTGDNTADITGDLTILGQTHPVTLAATFNRIAPSPWDDTVEMIGFSASTTISRSQWGMTYGEGAVGDTVQIDLDVEATRQK